MLQIPAVAAAAALLAIAPGWMLLYDATPKVSILLGAAGIVVWSGRLLPGLRSLWPDPSGRCWLAGIALWFAGAAFSTALSPEPSLSLFGGLWRRQGLMTHAAILLLALAAAALPPARWAAARIWTLAGALAAAYGIAQYFGFDPWLPAGLYHEGDGGARIVRPPSTMGHAAYSAAALAVLGFAGVALAARDRGFWRAAGTAGFVLCVAAVVLSGARAGLIALAAGGLYWWAAHRVRIRRRTLVALAAGIAIAVAAFVASPLGDRLRARWDYVSDDPLGGGRLRLWADSLSLVVAHPIAGHGPERFPVVFPQVQSEALALAYPDLFYESPHNLLLEVAAERGVGGLVALLLVLVPAFRASWRRRGDPVVSWVGAGLTASVAAHFFTGFTPANLALLLVLSAFAVSPDPPEGVPETDRSGWLLALASWFSLVMFGVALLLLLQDFRHRRIAWLLDAGLIDEAVQLRTPLTPLPVPEPDLWYSRTLFQSLQAAGTPQGPEVRRALWTSAIEASQSAEDRHNAIYHCAVLAASEGNAAESERYLRRAIAQAPSWYKPYWTLAQVLVVQNRLEDALQAANRAAYLADGRHPEVTAAAEGIRKLAAGE